MRITKQYVDDLKSIYYKKYGEELSERDAYDLAMNLMKLFQVLLRPPKANK